MNTAKRFVRDNDDNWYLVPESQANRFEELIEIEHEMGTEFSEMLTRELEKFDQYLVDLKKLRVLKLEMI